MRSIGGWGWVRIMGLPCSSSATHLSAIGPTFAFQLLIPLDEVLSVEPQTPPAYRFMSLALGHA